MKLHELKKVDLKMKTYDDGSGHIWDIVKEYPPIKPNIHPMFLATWVNKTGYKNIALFVNGVNKTWMTSMDGPFSNNQIRIDGDNERKIKEDEQLDEGLKQKLAALIIGALISATAHGGALDKNETKAELAKMTTAERAALKTVTTHSEETVDFQDFLKKEAAKKNVSPEVKKNLTDKTKLKKFTDELRALIKD